MPHEMIDDLDRRRHEKVAAFLTFENAVGIVLAALIGFIITSQMGLLLRIVIIGVSAGLGYLLTKDTGGLAFYERVLWMARGNLATRMHGQRLLPTDLAGSRAPGKRDRALPLDGPVRAVQIDTKRRRGQAVLVQPRVVPVKTLPHTNGHQLDTQEGTTDGHL